MKVKSILIGDLKRVFNVYDKKTKVSLAIFATLQILLSILDLVAVFLIGALALESVGSINPAEKGNESNLLTRMLGFNQFDQSSRIIYIAILAMTVLISKTFLSVIFTKKSMYFLSNKATTIAHELFSKYLAQPLHRVQRKSQQEIVFILTEGIHSITVQVSGSLVILIADFSLLLLMIIGLILIDPAIAIFTITFFVLIGLYLHSILSIRAAALGSEYFKISIHRNAKIVEALNSFREAVTGSRRGFYLNQVSVMRELLAKIEAQRSLMPYIGKYVIETSIVMAMILVTGFQFAFNPPSEAARNIAIFLAAGTRIAPAVLRIQQSVNQIKLGVSVGGTTLDLSEELREKSSIDDIYPLPKFIHTDFSPSVELRNLSISHPGNLKFKLNSIDLDIAAFKFVAIVGFSGAGKTTLVDVLLGINPPVSGEVLISGMSPLDAYRNFPGAVSYVPQEASLIDGTILENIAAGYLSPELYMDEVFEAINGAALEKYIEEAELGIHTLVGERGANISGGQRQRIAIARALFTKPSLIILDEATSALDSETESMITNTLSKLKGTCTIITIAHRLSTIKNADEIIFIQDDGLLSVGSFEELIEEFPEFKRQVNHNTVHSDEKI